jgi:hypothetical protein
VIQPCHCHYHNYLTLYRFHKGEQIKEGGRHKVSIVQDAKQFYLVSLEIANVDATDEGEYKAIARNGHGEGVATINLNFEGSGKPK